MEKYGEEQELKPSDTNDEMAASVGTFSINIKSPEDGDDDQTSGGVAINTAVDPLALKSPSDSRPSVDVDTESTNDIAWVDTFLEGLDINLSRIGGSPSTPSQPKPDGPALQMDEEVEEYNEDTSDVYFGYADESNHGYPRITTSAREVTVVRLRRVWDRELTRVTDKREQSCFH